MREKYIWMQAHWRKVDNLRDEKIYELSEDARYKLWRKVDNLRDEKMSLEGIFSSGAKEVIKDLERSDVNI